jgi:hypothetical protein
MTKEEVKKRIVEILDSYTKEMEGYSYYGSNPGVSHSDYEDIAEEICKDPICGTDLD